MATAQATAYGGTAYGGQSIVQIGSPGASASGQAGPELVDTGFDATSEAPTGAPGGLLDSLIPKTQEDWIRAAILIGLGVLAAKSFGGRS